jgi:hypothetical protein
LRGVLPHVISAVRRFLVNSYDSIFINILFLAFAFGYFGLTNNHAQNSKVPSDWKKVNACEISFFVPQDFKEKDTEGTDSCVTTFGNGKIWLHIDYGYYGGASENDETITDFKEELIKIDGKKTQLATYREDFADAKNALVARIYVVVDTSEKKTKGVITSLNMEVMLENEKDLATARQVFQSIRFRK